MRRKNWSLCIRICFSVLTSFLVFNISASFRHQSNRTGPDSNINTHTHTHIHKYCLDDIEMIFRVHSQSNMCHYLCHFMENPKTYKNNKKVATKQLQNPLSFSIFIGIMWMFVCIPVGGCWWFCSFSSFILFFFGCG